MNYCTNYKEIDFNLAKPQVVTVVSLQMGSKQMDISMNLT